MIKRREISDPNSCLNRADEEEPIFVLLGRDVAAPMTIRYWIHERIERNKNAQEDPQIQEAIDLIAKMEEWNTSRR